MDDSAFIEKLKTKGLEKLQKASELADQNDPDMPFVLEAIKQLKSQAPAFAGPPSTALPLRPEQQANIDRQLATTARPLPLPLHGVAQGAEDAVKGLAGGIYSGVPGLAPALEAAGELSDTLVPGQDPRFNIVPRPGQIHRAMAESPQGLEASAAIGASVPLAGQAGLLGKAAQAGSQAAMAPAARVFENLAGRQAPGLIRTVGAGAGTGAAIGAAEAGIRRLPAAEQALGQAAHGQDVTATVPQVDVAKEIIAPGAMGGISSILPGMSSWASNPRTQVGRRAATFARDKASGAHEQEPLRSLMEGQPGIEQAKEIANRNYQDQFPQLEQPVRAVERRQVGDLERGMDTFKADAMKSRGDAADETAQAITKKLEGQRTATHQRRAADMQELDSRTKGQALDTSAFFDKVNGLVDGFSSQSASKPTDRVLLPNGRALAAAADELGQFLPPEGATMRDLRNAKTFAKSRANSGTDEQRWPYEVLLGELNKHIKAVDPTSEGGEPGLYAQSNERFRADKTRQERTKQIVFGGPDEAKVDLSPQVEARGRQGLMQLGEGTASASAKLPHREELIKNGYGPEVEAMEGRLRDIEQMTYETQQKHDDAVASVKAEVAQQLRDISRELIPQTDSVLESKVAQEASKLRFSKLARPLTEAALGAASHSPAYAGARGADAATKIGDRIAQPLASAISSRLPDASSMRSSIPGMMGVSTAASGAEASRKMVDEARKQKERFKNSIGSIVDYIKARKAQ